MELADLMLPPATGPKRLCQRDPATGRCTQCGKPRALGLNIECPAHPNANYRPPTRPKPPGLGDLAEEFFKSLGITEERYKEVKSSIPFLDPTCNCKDRKEWLNKVGDELGISGAAAKLVGWWKKRTA